MKILVDQLFIEWNELETPEEYEIMRTYAETGKRYSVGYTCKSKVQLLFFG